MDWKTMSVKTRNTESYQGMNWIRKEKRLAIYLRDGLCCAYCGIGVESGSTLTLDHLKPYSSGGSNKETNLVTCCSTCNSSRHTSSWRVFAEKKSIERGLDASQVIARIQRVREHKLRLADAKHMILDRGFINIVRGGNGN
jgi:hypothetical protein